MTLMPRLALALLLTLPALASAEECPWVEPKKGPALEVGDGFARFEWPLDRKWFGCAKKAGGKLTVTYLLGGKTGPMQTFKEFQRSSATAREGIYRNQFCKFEPLPHRVQVKVAGTGAFERLSFESEVKPIHCDRCEYRSYESMFAIHSRSALTPKGFVTLDGRYGDRFHACAVEDKEAKLELRVYVGKTATEARKRLDHTFVLTGIEKAPKFKKALSLAELCAEGAKWIGVEYFGTHEFAKLNGTGRHAREIHCD